jgi:hypothetical protein
VDPLAELARKAYAIGWARSGGPMTDRVRAGCTSAVSLAIEHANRPGVLEATLDLGHLEGVWADLYARRDDVEVGNRATIGKAWAAYVANLDLDRLARGRARRIGVVAEADGHGGGFGLDDGPGRDELAAIVVAALQNLDHGHPEEWTALRTAFRDAIAAGRAEGATGAVALAAREHTIAATLRLDFGVAFDDAYRALEHVAGLWSEGDGWIQTMFGYAASDIGRSLAALTRDEASYDDIRDVVARHLDDPDARAVDIAVNQLTGRALTQGALDLYAQAGVGQVDVLTAGDGRVDQPCEDAEAGSPYRLGAVPALPLHPYCRCSVAARDPLPADLYTRYLVPQEG